MVRTLKTIEEFKAEWIDDGIRDGSAGLLSYGTISNAKDKKWFRVLKEHLKIAESKGIEVMYYCSDIEDRGKKLYFIFNSEYFNLNKEYAKGAMGIMRSINEHKEPSLKDKYFLIFGSSTVTGTASCCPYFG